MRALYFEKFNGPIEIRDIEVPYPAPKSVLIKVEATGLCRSDWHGYVGHDSDISLPHVPGHELAGTIAQIGNQVKNFKVGDRVTVPFVNGCGECEWCTSGNAQVCPKQTQPGFTQFGSFAEYVEIKNSDFNLIALPSEISFEVAAALGCRFATAFRGLTTRGGINPGDLVAIIGCGGVGLSAVMIAKAFGATVVAVDINEVALQNAKLVGADYLFNSVSAETEIQKLGGAHIAVDALGSVKTAELSVLLRWPWDG
jgi:alcohol dehydrogenase